MPYTDKAYFLQKIKLAKLENLIKDNEGVPQDSRLVDAIKAADSTINGYLKKALKTIPIPDAKVPENIKLFSYYISMYILHENIQNVDIPERIKENYDLAISYLTDVAQGNADLDITEETEGEELTSQTDYEVEPNVFDRNSF